MVGIFVERARSVFFYEIVRFLCKEKEKTKFFCIFFAVSKETEREKKKQAQ